jgi:hypothetical protein
MRSLLENVLSCETPMAPSEISDLVQREEVQSRGRWFLQGVGLEREMRGARFDVFEELPVVSGTIGPEVLKYAGQRRIGHGDLEEVVAEWDLYHRQYVENGEPSEM